MSQLHRYGSTEDLGAGRFRTALSAAPENWPRPDGVWQPIRRQSGTTNDPDHPLGLSGEISAFFAARTGGTGPFLTLRRGASLCHLTPLNLAPGVVPVVDAVSAFWPGAWPGADLRYTNAGHLLHKDILLHPGHPAAFSFRLDRRSPFRLDAGRVVFGDFAFASPRLVGPRGQAGPPLAWALGALGGLDVLTIALPAGDWSGWALDPTTTLQPGAEGFDAYLQEDLPTTNFGASTLIKVGDDAAARTRMLIKFDLSSIPAPVTAVTSTFTLTTEDAGPVTPTVELRRLLRDWTEGGATWNTSGVSAWTVGGAGSDGNDRSTTVSSSAIIPLTSPTPVNWTGAAQDTDVQSFINSPENNFGWLAQMLAGASFRSFASSDHATAGDRPKLVVAWTPVVTGIGLSRGLIRRAREGVGKAVGLGRADVLH